VRRTRPSGLAVLLASLLLLVSPNVDAAVNAATAGIGGLNNGTIAGGDGTRTNGPHARRRTDRCHTRRLGRYGLCDAACDRYRAIRIVTAYRARGHRCAGRIGRRRIQHDHERSRYVWRAGTIDRQHDFGKRLADGAIRRQPDRAGRHAAAQRQPDAFDARKIATQFGTLGGGNHFIELTADEDDRVWIVLHSGSRGPGNLFAQEHIGRARKQIKKVLEQPLEDPDLAYFVQGSPEFEQYVEGMLWAQDYALENRAEMMRQVVNAVDEVMARGGGVTVGRPIQCHHNYAALERHHGKELWVTRKGAIDASEGRMGIIPGSMATGSIIVSGRGNPDSYRSASHGAGRRLSRTAARKHLSEDSLSERMAGIAWNEDAHALLDEHPDAYKDLGEVMENQKDLVRIEHRLETILNYKGS